MSSNVNFRSRYALSFRKIIAAASQQLPFRWFKMTCQLQYNKQQLETLSEPLHPARLMPLSQATRKASEPHRECLRPMGQDLVCQ